MSNVDIDETDTRVVVTARGGTRRERGSRVGAVVRGRGLKLSHVNYSETYGFQSATYATYSK